MSRVESAMAVAHSQSSAFPHIVARAVEAACASCECAPSFAMLAPETDAAGIWRYTLFAEGEIPPELFSRLDAELRANPHYALCRDLGQLDPPACCAVMDGYQIFCDAFVARGLRLGDIKPQALSTRTDWRDRFSKNLPSANADDPCNAFSETSPNPYASSARVS